MASANGMIESWNQAGVPTAAGLKHIARIGFDCVDIATEAVGISKQEVRTVARTTEKLASFKIAGVSTRVQLMLPFSVCCQV